ncbi:phage holin family protein [Sulfitobacter sp. JB4-11]|uniref:phage holin family protein n=1 Tax=Sulfitobacter rhodophyticola TaxID=3238304 RepID=UPI003514AE29
MFDIEQKVANTAKRAGLLSGGLLLCAVGTAFLTVAGWFALVPVVGLQMTALIIAGCYLGIGLIMIGVGSGSSDTSAPTKAESRKAEVGGPPIVQAFMYGLQAGAQAERKRR